MITDNNPLCYIQTSGRLGATEQRWVSQLSQYDFTVKYRPRKQILAADALSRMPSCYAQLAEVRRNDTKINTDLHVEALKSAICNIEKKGHSVGLCYNSISFPKYDGNDISHMQQNDPILGRFLYYFTSGKKPRKKERLAENKLVTQMLRQRDRMFLDKKHVLCRVVKDPQAGELKQLAFPACLREQVMDALHTHGSPRDWKNHWIDTSQILLDWYVQWCYEILQDLWAMLHFQAATTED